MKDIIERHLKLGWICNSDHFVLTQAKDQPTLLFFTHANLFDLRQFLTNATFLTHAKILWNHTTLPIHAKVLPLPTKNPPTYATHANHAV